MIRLETERLWVRQPSLTDVPSFGDYLRRNRKFHQPYVPRRPDSFYTDGYWEKALAQMVEVNLSGTQVNLLLLPKDQAKIIGVLNFNHCMRGAFQATIAGYMMDEGEQGKGLMKEALTAGIQLMFEGRNFHRIMANYLVDNHRSAALLKGLGFVVEGTAKDYLFLDGQWRDHILTSLTNPHWVPTSFYA